MSTKDVFAPMQKHLTSAYKGLVGARRTSNRWPGRRSCSAAALVFLLGCLVSLAASGYTLEQFEFDTQEEADAFRTLLTELRCVVCQNETLAGSQADVAQIMREEVYRLIQEGKDETQIKAHLVDRYTDFVLYDPPLKPSTYLIWIGPFALMALGAFFLARTLMVKKRSLDRGLSTEDQQRLQALLARPESDQDTPQ